MAVLNDVEIARLIKAGELRVGPWEPSLIRPAALSLRLGSTASTLVTDGVVDAADARTYPKLVRKKLDERGRLPIHPGEFVLAATLETLTLPADVSGFVDGISNVARLGIGVALSHYVNPGFGQPNGGVLTLEIHTRLQDTVLLYPGVRICNLVLFRGAAPQQAYHTFPANHSHDVRETGSAWFELHPGGDDRSPKP